MENIDIINNARRLCLSQKSCDKCPLNGLYPCGSNIAQYINANGSKGVTAQINIIIDWAKRYPEVNANLIEGIDSGGKMCYYKVDQNTYWM